jgi:endonuclease III related protein
MTECDRDPAQFDTTIRDFYDRLLAAFGPQNWWPADSQTEIIVGAILTQNTSWTNVEYALENLKREELLDWARLRDTDESVLSTLIRPAGYHNLKAKRLKNFVRWLWTSLDGDPSNLNALALNEARTQLLSVNGIGPETADSIILYALDRPSFVVDTYTGRILRRHRIADAATTYDEFQSIFVNAIPHDAGIYNEYHALIVRLAKEHCRVKADCRECPLAHHAHDEHLR